MIAILKKDGRYIPVILCDHCGAVIDDALAAMELSSSAPEGATAQAFHVHKGACDQALSARLGGIHGSEELAVHLVEATKSLGGRIYMGLFAVVLAPVAEEFIFRGLLFPFIRQLGFPRLAWLGVSALFALIHWDAATFAPLFVLALALTWLYNQTGNLLAPITAHALFNAVNLAVILGSGDTQAP